MKKQCEIPMYCIIVHRTFVFPLTLYPDTTFLVASVMILAFVLHSAPSCSCLYVYAMEVLMCF